MASASYAFSALGYASAMCYNLVRAMQITKENLEDNQVLLNVQVEEERVEKSLDQAYKRLVQRANIPGFRRGKAPRSMVERYFGREAVLEDALEKLLPELTQEAIKEEGIEPLAQPRIELVQVDPVIFKAVVPLPPSVELPDYREIRVQPKEASVSEEQVSSFLDDIRWDATPWEPAEGAAKMGDLVTVDLQAEENGNKVLEREGLPVLLSEEARQPVPGLVENLVGMEKGASKDFPVSFPEDYDDKDLAGHKLNCHIQVKEIKEKHLPVLDDEFAKGVGEGYESLEALRQQVYGRMEERAQNEAKTGLENEVVQAVVAGARVEFPPVLAERETEVLLNEMGGRLERQGINLAQYLKFTNKSEAELVDEVLPQARERVKRRLVLDRVAEAEGIKVEPEELNAEIEEAVKEAGAQGDRMREILDAPSGRATIEQILKTRKTLARLVELATAPEPSAPAAKETAEAVATAAPEPHEQNEEEPSQG